MSGDLAEIGKMIGKVLAQKSADASGPVYVHPPNVAVNIDPAPLAEAMHSGHQQNVKALETLGHLLTDAVCKSVGEAISLIPDADLVGVEVQLSRLAAAVEAKTNQDVVAAIADLKSAFAENTKAVADLVQAVSEQNRIMMKSKTVSYDAQGRVNRVEVG